MTGWVLIVLVAKPSDSNLESQDRSRMFVKGLDFSGVILLGESMSMIRF